MANVSAELNGSDGSVQLSRNFFGLATPMPPNEVVFHYVDSSLYHL